MPNDCMCNVRIGASASMIEDFSTNEFSFEKILPCPNPEDWYKWRLSNWGTKWDRYEYKLIKKGTTGIEMRFMTAWNPPFQLFEHLLDNHKDIFIRCDWEEEGGMAGVFVGQWSKGELRITRTDWEDWCAEEWAARMRSDEDFVYFDRPRSHCIDEDEWMSDESQLAIKITEGEYKRRIAELRSSGLDDCDARNMLVKMEADKRWPTFSKN